MTSTPLTHRARVGHVGRPETLTEAVVRHIREAVVRGDLSPGSPLPEIQLAEELETSRGTVREALRALQDIGIVEIHPHRGAFVTEISAQRTHEMLLLRSLLEGHAARIAVETGRVTPDAAAKLEAAYDRMLAARDAGDGSLVEAHLAFHWTIAELGGVQLFLDHLAKLQVQTRRLVVYTEILASEDPSGHRALVDAILDADPDRVEHLVREHTRSSGTRILARIAELATGRSHS